MTSDKPVLRRHSPSRDVFCNRTLNLRSIKAFGYDLDYTLTHYHTAEWERTSFEHLKRKLAARGWPVQGVNFDLQGYQMGLIIDRELGNILKANQFGYVKRVAHGTRMLDFDELRDLYAEAIVEFPDPRFVFLNTLFSLSEASMYTQLVDLLDAGKIAGALGYVELYRLMKESLDEAHMEGQLKDEIAAAPERFVDLDPETPLTLLDQRQAGNKILLITNSDWSHTRRMMSYAFDRFLPKGMHWRELFDVIIVSARKPAFFTQIQPAFEVIDEEGLLRPVIGKPPLGRVLLGGHAELVEEMLGLKGSQILYVGDHAYGDVHISKKLRRWRTALILRRLEAEIRAQEAFRPRQSELERLMGQKAALERALAQKRLEAQRLKHATPRTGLRAIEREVEQKRQALAAIDATITPLAQASGELFNRNWGLLMRSGNDKSYLARLVERHADIYTSRVSNLLHETPYAFFRAHRGLMPHDEWTLE
jgi:5'-nucleotidase